MACRARQGFWLTARRLRRDDRGATVVLVALVTTALLAITGLSVDVGWWYTIQRQNQSAADSAAISAAYEVLAGKTDVTNNLTPAAKLAATLNGYTGTADPDVKYPCGASCLAANSAGVQVVLNQAQSSWFALLVGFIPNPAD
jgi:Flp pilus assembly protein TadG